LIRYFDMFAGVGGFRAGLTQAGGFECVGHCEIDKYANASYIAAHNPGKEEKYYKDAREIEPDDMPEFDLLCAGFPCQAVSIAGARRGFDDPRGALFFELVRIAAARRPRYLLFENVPGLLHHASGNTFAQILNALCELGYCVEWSVCNSKDYHVPQSRRRVYIVGYLDTRCAGKILPVGEANQKALKRVAGRKQGYTVYDAKGLACTQTANTGGLGKGCGLYLVGFNRKDGVTGELTEARTLQAGDFRGLNRNQTQNAVFVDLCAGNPQVTEQARCVTADYGKAQMSNRKGELSGVLTIDNGQLTMDNSEDRNDSGKSDYLLIKEATKRGFKEAYDGDSVYLGFPGTNKRRARVGTAFAHTLDTGSSQGVVLKGRIRRLMPRECFRLQGFPEDMIDRMLAVTSDAQAYKQAGNSVTVNVVEAIGRRLRALDEELKAGAAHE